jgi:fucose 4-O-acetylase-like acetyltransferase
MNIPEPIVHWGHPLMMGIVVFVMGSVVGLTGWRGRQLGGAEAAKSWADHKKIAPLMVLFIALGYTGGVLSLVMQQQPILQSPHFWTGSAAIVLLTVNALLAAVRFGKNKTALRTTHAYVGSAALCLLFLHAIFGLKLGLSI